MRRRRGDGFGDIDWSRVDWRELSGLRGRGRPPRRVVNLTVTVVVALVLLFTLGGPLVRFWTDLLWFASVGYEDVFLLRYQAGFLAFAAFFFVFLAFGAVNLAIALRPRVVPRVVEVGGLQPELFTPRRVTLLLLVPSFLFGLAAGGQWDELLRFLNATPFGATDPLFGQDVAFYLFTLPVLDFVRGWAMLAVVLVAAGVVAAYLARGAFDVATGGFEDLRGGARALLAVARPVRAHLSVLGALFLVLVAFGYQLERYDLLFRAEAVLTGAGFTSVNARIPALTVLTAIAGLAAALLLANVWARTLWLLGATLGVWLAAAVLAGLIYPGLVERFVVQPAQLEREREFIARHIAATRAAYGIDRVEETAFDVKDQPTPDDVRRDLAAIENIRVWDHRPLRQTLQQIQSIRVYYEFPDIDVTRVATDGAPQQVMVAARELNAARIPQTWVNVHLRFTHGYGATATPVSAVTAEGLPALSLKDLPPQGQPKIDRPQIYFGALTTHYVIVGTTENEFDFPKENIDQTTRFDAPTGIPVGSLWDRLLFAARFGDLNLLISTQLTPESRLLMHRGVRQRARLIAPFLRFDRDPYLAFDGGKLFWIHDAYTTAERYPYAEAFGRAPRHGAENVGDPDLRYIRNSVKVVTDAYDGTIRFYLADPTDPVARTLAKIYPRLFRPLAEMPAGLRAQLRYPEDLFRIQTTMYARYHVTDPTAFYNGSDQWQVADEILAQGGSKLPIEPYYVITRLPGADRPEFLLFVPMTPAGRDNMIGWLAGRSDEPNYGKLRALRFATDRVIFGPLQIEARIDQDPVIKTQLALLSQAGTQVERGNLLVIPVGSSFIYVEPIFIRAQTGSIPELRRIVLATQTRVVMGETFPQALSLLVGAAAGQPPAQPPPTLPTGAIVPPEVRDLVRSASEHYEKALAALRAGDFATYGAQLKALEQDLARLRELTGAR